MNIDRIKQLRQDIEHYNKLYYAEDSPIITDQEYDKLFRELVELEKQFPEMRSLDSPTLRIGSAPLSKFESFHHRYKMYSLNNAMTNKEFESFFNSVMKIKLISLATPSIVLEYKFDGLALELIYKDGILIEASTRGDGEVGELVTENVRTIQDIPLHLEGEYPEDLVVYGESIIFKDDFLKLNEKRKQNNEKEFTNPRNAAAGSIRLLDSHQTAERKLSFFAYDCKTEDKNSNIGILNLHTHRMDELEKMGFAISPLRKIIHPGNLHEAYEYHKIINEKRKELPFDIDGVVAKTVMDEVRDVLGYAERFPKWAIAWKFEAEENQTILKNIEYEAGRTGALTPVAILEPIELSGVIVSRATLNNFDYIIERDFRVGDTVVIKRAGDVIPFVVRSILELRPQNSEIMIEPSNCPVCNTPTEKSITNANEEARVLRCPNNACEGRLAARLRYFVSKQGLDIEGFGDRVVNTLFSEGLLGSKEYLYIDALAAIFKLKDHKEKLLTLEGFGEKSVNQLLDEIEKKKYPTLSRFIQAFGIRSIGSVSSSKLANYFSTFDEFAKAYQQNGSEYDILEDINKIRGTIYALQLQKSPIEAKEKGLKEALVHTEDLIIHAQDRNNNDLVELRKLEKHQLEEQLAVLKPLKKESDSKITKLRVQEPEFVQKLVLGVSTTEELVKFFTETRSHMELENLLNTGFTIQEEIDSTISILGHTVFTGKKILVTGKSHIFSTRKEMIDLIESIGAHSMAGVTGNVDLIIEGEKPGSGKIKKALDLNIPIIKEKDFLDQLDATVLTKFKELFNYL